MIKAQNFINGYLEGTRIIDVKDYYSLLAQYEAESPREKLPLHIYTINYIDKHFEKMCKDVTTLFVKNHSKDYLGGSISDALVEEFEKYYVSEISRTLAEICTE